MKLVSVTFLYDMFSVFTGKALILQAFKYNLFEIWKFYFFFCLLQMLELTIELRPPLRVNKFYKCPL